MNSLRLAIKRYFPNIYIRIRRIFFRYVIKLRNHRATYFTQPIFKNISTNGQHFTIKLDPQNGFVDRNIFTAGVYEPDILAVIKDYLPSGGTYVDIGTNIGQHALFAASVVGPQGRVIAFEPIPRLVTQFSESITINQFTDRITIHTVGCSDRTEQQTLKIMSSNVGGSSLHETKIDSDTSLTINLAPADTYLSKEQKIDLIKIDTEGHEYEVFEGLKNTIARTKPTIIFEYSPTFRHDIEPIRTFDVLQENHYRYFDLEDGHKEITDLSNWVANFKKRQTNLLCIPN